jgi:hypothetical protein
MLWHGVVRNMSLKAGDAADAAYHHHGMLLNNAVARSLHMALELHSPVVV